MKEGDVDTNVDRGKEGDVDTGRDWTEVLPEVVEWIFQKSRKGQERILIEAFTGCTARQDLDS